MSLSRLDKEISDRMDKADQYKGRKNCLEAWEDSAPKEDIEKFYSYVRVWLLKRASGSSIGWKSFTALCCEDIDSFNLREQGLMGALSGPIKRL